MLLPIPEPEQPWMRVATGFDFYFFCLIHVQEQDRNGTVPNWGWDRTGGCPKMLPQNSGMPHMDHDSSFSHGKRKRLNVAGSLRLC